MKLPGQMFPCSTLGEPTNHGLEESSRSYQLLRTLSPLMEDRPLVSIQTTSAPSVLRRLKNDGVLTIHPKPPIGDSPGIEPVSPSTLLPMSWGDLKRRGGPRLR